MKMEKKLKRQYFEVKDAVFGEKTVLRDRVLTISREALKEEIRPLLKAVKSVGFEIVKPGENTRIIHLLDTLQPMLKVESNIQDILGIRIWLEAGPQICCQVLR